MKTIEQVEADIWAKLKEYQNHADPIHVSKRGIRSSVVNMLKIQISTLLDVLDDDASDEIITQVGRLGIII